MAEAATEVAAAGAPLVSAPPAIQPGVVAAGVYVGGRRIVDIPIEEAGEWSQQARARRLDRPARARPTSSCARFSASSACTISPSRTRATPISGRRSSNTATALFIVARTAQMVDGRIAFGETHLFVGRGYVVSVRHGASTSYTPVRRALRGVPEGALATARTSSSTPSSTSSSTTTCRCSRRSRQEVEEIEDSVLAQPR